MVLYYDLLKPDKTITGELYQAQLILLSRILHEKRPWYKQRPDRVTLQHDSAGSHIAKPVETYIETLK